MRLLRWFWSVFAGAVTTFLHGIILSIAALVIVLVLVWLGVPQEIAEQIAGR